MNDSPVNSYQRMISTYDDFRTLKLFKLQFCVDRMTYFLYKKNLRKEVSHLQRL